jgi:hypothetical protein
MVKHTRHRDDNDIKRGQTPFFHILFRKRPENLSAFSPISFSTAGLSAMTSRIFFSS